MRVEASSPALVPLRHGAFRMLWATGLIANVSVWMGDVSAAWLMTTLTADPLWIALVQTASMLPMFLLAFPSGALADNLDRRKFLLATQLYVAATAALLALAAYRGWMTPGLLLALVFAGSIGLAMRMPVLAAVVSEVVPRAELPAAVALNGISMNASRIAGPILAGLLITHAGAPWVFLLNALLALATMALLARWRRPAPPRPLGRERLRTALRVGRQYVAQSRALKGVLWRLGAFFFCSVALTSLLPLLARRMQGGGAGAFTLLLASMGLGAIAAALMLPRLRARYTLDGLLARGAALQAVAMVGMAWSDRMAWAMPMMFLSGMAWIANGNTLNVAAQLGLPDWVRARGMSVSIVAVMGASAAGAATWGQLAATLGVSASLLIAAVLVMAGMLATARLLPQAAGEDITPHPVRQPYGADRQAVPGRVVLTIEFRIDPQRAEEFCALMWRESRPSRLRQGALSWELQRDLDDPGRFVEVVTDESWAEHLRRFERVTVADAQLRDRKRAFHLGQAEPAMRRYVTTSRRSCVCDAA